MLERTANLLLKIVVLDDQKFLSEQNLKFLDDDFAGIVDANESRDDVACIAGPEFCGSHDHAQFTRTIFRGIRHRNTVERKEGRDRTDDALTHPELHR